MNEPTGVSNNMDVLASNEKSKVALMKDVTSSPLSYLSVLRRGLPWLGV